MLRLRQVAGMQVLALICVAAPAAGPPSVQFNRDIRPILSDKCYTCHGPDSATRKSPLRFDSEQGASVALDNGGHAIVSGRPEESVLFQRINSEDPVLRMPPSYEGKDKLSGKEIELIRRWIEKGAKWESHWSFTELRRPAPPNVSSDRARNAIDQFVLSRLEEEALSPSAEADKRALIRRLSLDLRGLPPTPDEVDAFLGDRSAKAYESLVDRLLASPHYGERMAAVWLDAARYADTNGYQSDGVRSMWRWRDWVIDAFNRNLPFDRFTIEQLAGDLLPGATREQRIATAFNRNHRTSAEGGTVEEEFRVEYVADRLETTATVWLGLTVGCARCHDHKYDPITQKEYYQLFGFFNNMSERGLVYNFGNEEPFIKAPTPLEEERLAKLDAQAAKAEQAYRSLSGEIEQSRRRWEEWLAISRTSDWAVSDGLVLRYSLDGDARVESSGWVSAKTKLGSTIKDPDHKPSLDYAAGPLGKAARFDGKDYVDAGEVADFDYQDPFTLSAWINPELPNGAILSRTDDFPQGQGIGLYLKNGKLWLHITRRWTDIGLRIETRDPLALGRWQHVAVSYDGKRKSSGVAFYVDGKPREVEVLFDELTYPFSTKEPFKIGAGGGPENSYTGLIDEVGVYNRALTAEEVSTLVVTETPAQIAALPPEKRTSAQASKLALCFLTTASPAHIQQARAEAADARARRDEFYGKIPTVMVMLEGDKPRDTFILQRGAYDAPGDQVFSGVPAVLPPLPAGAENNRLGLAKWIVDRRNPLTSRVAVNRVWEMLFGAGLVKTVENFGSQGERPSHPELLDWLAVDFVESGWDVKGLLKTIVTSATYRQSSKSTPELLEKDPDNRLLARGPRFRLPAETIRDQALASSGLLSEQIGGPPVKPYQPTGLWEELTSGSSEYEVARGDDLYRRSLYTYWRRTIPPPAMTIFDAANRETCSVREPRTNTPLQALNLMNDTTYVEAARKLAERMMLEGGPSERERIEHGFRLATARDPSPQETALMSRLFAGFVERYRQEPKAARATLAEGRSPWDKTLPPAELAAYSGVAGLILNLDETINKE